LPKIEEKVLDFWKTNHIFEKSLERRKGKKTFVFYEGPPYANGKPGIHHVLARVVKDIILRYKSMRGYYVPRRAGWDTHGLPVEIAAEKALGLKSKKEIEKLGIKLFNKKAKEAVWIYKDEWEKMTRRIGYWLDLDNAYITYTSDYIETLWWTLKRIWEKGLLYKGHKVVPWCPRCGTALSSHELAQGYQEITENSVYLKFKIISPNPKWKDAFILSWTTTPWTLPGNVALAVGQDITYVSLRLNKEKDIYIIAEALVEKVFGGQQFEKIQKFKGKELVGLKYKPLFDIKALKNKVSYRVYPADFVTIEEGTGVVHTAVMYGEDDYELGKKVGLPQHHTVLEDGKFTKDVKGLAGLFVKTEKTEEKIFQHLTKQGNLFKIEKYTHEYPFCWRCETPLLYYARDSWFITMSKLRKKLLSNNKKINWFPTHLKEGRFGEWLREAKDWNLSRERYWSTPLPIWECKKCKSHEVFGSLDELSTRAGGSENHYWVMRHGESETQLRGVIDYGQKKYHLTTIGRSQVAVSVKKLKIELGRRRKKVDLIISSDVLRAKESAKIAASVLGAKKIVFDKRLHEMNFGIFSGRRCSEYHKAFPTYESKFEKQIPKGESLRDLRHRLWDFIKNMEKRYKNKNILIISHEYPLWMLSEVALGWNERQAIAEKKRRGPDFVNVAEVRRTDFKIVPRDEKGDVDLHRPYADEIIIACRKCKGKMARVKEVADVWYDSGAMPLAQFHYPFENKNLIDNKIMYPADYIAEGMDQTRGWFYTLLAIATALGYNAPYKNVISLGLVNDKFGQKMSKSKGNVVDTMEVINKYGIDAVRWYLYTINPLGEPKNFNEEEVQKAFRRMHFILYNAMVFYDTYAQKLANVNKPTVVAKNLLDKWILARLEETKADVTKKLENYNIRDAALSIEGFIDDLSRWYIRRSRRRFSAVAKGYGGQAKTEHKAASATLERVLSELSKLLAPFTPFFAEELYKQLRGQTRTVHGLTQKFQRGLESVHLADWPKADPLMRLGASKKLIESMSEIRRLVSLALAKRAEAGIKVRQPLAKLSIKYQVSGIKLEKGLLDILKDEVNVKKIVFDKKIKDEIELDVAITPELREEGILREVVRMVQDLRQKAGLRPKDKIILMAELPEEIRRALSKKEKVLKAEVGAKKVEYKKSSKFNAETSTKLENQEIWLAVMKTKT